MSTETVLAGAGIIQQQVQSITFVSSISRQFALAGHNFRSRKLSDIYLYNEAGISPEDGVRIASPARAIADMLYFNPHYHFDASEHIDWNAVNSMQTEVGYAVTDRKHI